MKHESKRSTTTRKFLTSVPHIKVVSADQKCHEIWGSTYWCGQACTARVGVPSRAEVKATIQVGNDSKNAERVTGKAIRTAVHGV